MRHEINRQNAQSSTGPRTPEGKEAAAQNARTHGMTAKKLVLTPEDREQLEQLHHGIVESYLPANALERALARQAAEFQFRLHRCFAIETAMLQQTMDQAIAEGAALSGIEASALVFTDERYQRRLQLFMRYQKQIDSGWRKAVAELERVIAERREREAAEAEQAAAIAFALRREQAPKSKQTQPEPQAGFVSQTNETPAPPDADNRRFEDTAFV